MTMYTLFGQPASPATLTNDSADYTMGVQFSVSASGCTLTAIWFWSAPGAGALPDSIALYAVAGASLVHTEAASWSGAAGSGWVRAAFASPPSLTSGTSYKACIFENTGNFFYAGTSHYWDTGSGSGGITNGPLSAPANSGADGGQDTFTNSSTLSYPSGSFNSANYWVDPEVTTSATPVSDSDAGTGTDAGTVTAGVPGSDTGTGADSASLAASVPGADTSSGTDAGSVTAALQGADSGSGADASGGITASVPGADTGTGAEGGSLGIPSADTGTGAESASLTAAVPGSDTAAAADAGTVTAAAHSADAGSGAESGVASIPAPAVRAQDLGGTAVNADGYGGTASNANDYGGSIT